MRGDVDLRQPHHQKFADPVIEHALAGNGAFFLGVEGRGIILEILNERAGFWSLEQNFCFAFIELPAAGHDVPQKS